MSREFDLGDVLSVTTGVLVSPRHMDGIYDILGYMTGDTLWTHQLIRAGDECRGPLLQQHPQLAAVKVPELTPETYLDWLADMKAAYGETLPVAPISDWQHINPVEELCDRVGAERVWVVSGNPPDSES